MFRNMLALLVVVLVATCPARGQQEPPAGQWLGTASIGQETTRIRITLSEAGSGWAGSVDLLDLGVVGWPASEVLITEHGVTVTIPSDSGPQTLTLVSTERGRLTGEWTESRPVGPARLELEHLGAAPEQAESRLIVEGPAGALGVSIISPTNEAPIAGVVFVHGSGAQPRDATRFHSQMFAEAGIASAMYDKRGVGESEGDWLQADFDDLARDAVAVADRLALETGLRPDQIGFVGYSQGGWIGPVAAALREDTAFVISIAGPATTPGEEGHWGSVRSLRQAGYGADVQSRASSILDTWNSGIRAGGDFSAFERARSAVENEPWFAASLLGEYGTADLSPAWIAWYAGILDFDPVPVLRATRIPFLSLMGDADEEQPWDRSTEIFEALAAEGLPVETHLYAGVTHSMRHASSEASPRRWPGRPSDFYTRQVDFIRRQVGD
ncbi:alpha/beta hydrolase [Maricaulis sp.]|uniref:alpha/beta hydrolase family protein n=1 Tax=Maricaulis sp. TaxID=1486257 RepID=UPI0025C0A536|nr:alpha/beta hydrolase [Maricaulis sp.]